MLCNDKSESSEPTPSSSRVGYVVSEELAKASSYHAGIDASIIIGRGISALLSSHIAGIVAPAFEPKQIPLGPFTRHRTRPLQSC